MFDVAERAARRDEFFSRFIDKLYAACRSRAAASVVRRASSESHDEFRAAVFDCAKYESAHSERRRLFGIAPVFDEGKPRAGCHFDDARFPVGKFSVKCVHFIKVGIVRGYGDFFPADCGEKGADAAFSAVCNGNAYDISFGIKFFYRFFHDAAYLCGTHRAFE